MPTAVSPHEGRDLVALASLWKDILEHLRRKKQSLAEEIRRYPTPITRCDAQFNHLYEQQARLARELDRIDAAKPTRADYIDSIEKFIASAPFSDDAEERDFRARIKRELSAPEE
jgi:hypothetical protein